MHCLIPVAAAALFSLIFAWPFTRGRFSSYRRYARMIAWEREDGCTAAAVRRMRRIARGYLGRWLLAWAVTLAIPAATFAVARGWR